MQKAAQFIRNTNFARKKQKSSMQKKFPPLINPTENDRVRHHTLRDKNFKEQRMSLASNLI